MVQLLILFLANDPYSSPSAFELSAIVESSRGSKYFLYNVLVKVPLGPYGFGPILTHEHRPIGMNSTTIVLGILLRLVMATWHLRAHLRIPKMILWSKCKWISGGLL